MCIQRYLIVPTLLAAILLHKGNGSVAAQDFRTPLVPGAVDYPLPAEGIEIQGVLQTQEPRGFVPSAGRDGLGLVPVQPRTGTPQSQQVRQLRPDYPLGRSEEDARILEQMRSGKFDPAVSNNTADHPEPEHQIIRQRYPDGKVQLMRQVAQDEDGNYFNDGPWQLFNKRGELMASGQFANGVMDGRWERWHAANSTGMFQTRPFTEFEGPFVSTATFKTGKLDGVWSISDRNQRTIVEVPYSEGKRHGTATWSYPNSQPMRTTGFRNGMLDGSLLEWDDKNELVRNDEYIAGQKVVRLTTFFRPEQKSTETFFLDSQLELDGQDNWWDAEPAEYKQLGTRVQHGPSVAWHSNGQRKMSGQFLNDVRVGEFVWWHENGTRALAGQYDTGRKTGLWTWWHDNGMKSIEGSYESDVPIGPWTWWDADGQIRNQEDFGDNSATTGVLVDPVDSNRSHSANDESESKSEPNAGSDSELKKNPPSEGIQQMEEIRPVEEIDEDFPTTDDGLEADGDAG